MLLWVRFTPDGEEDPAPEASRSDIAAINDYVPKASSTKTTARRWRGHRFHKGVWLSMLADQRLTLIPHGADLRLRMSRTAAVLGHLGRTAHQLCLPATIGRARRPSRSRSGGSRNLLIRIARRRDRTSPFVTHFLRWPRIASNKSFWACGC